MPFYFDDFFCKSNQFSTLIQRRRIEFWGLKDVEATFVQPVFAQWVVPCELLSELCVNKAAS